MAVDALHSRTKAWVAVLLTFAAGCVDIVGYLTIYKAFTANMTGNTVHLAQNAFQGHWQEAAAAACVIGSIIGRAIIEVGVRAQIRRIASAALLIESMLIATVAVTTRSSHFEGNFAGNFTGAVLGFLSILAAAMGVQTAILTRIGSLTVHTTFVTGMLNKLAQLLSQAAFLSYDRSTGKDVLPAREKVLRQARFIFSIWLIYLVGAAAGTWMSSVWGTKSLLAAIFMIGLAILADQITPLSIEEEHDQP